MTSYATPDDVAADWRALSEEEAQVATTKLAFASAILRSEFPDLDQRIARGDLEEVLVKGVVVSMVVRAMRNPDGVAQTTTQSVIDGYTRSTTEVRDRSGASGGLVLLEDERALLRGSRGKAFSVAPSVPRPTRDDLEKVARHRARRELGLG